MASQTPIAEDEDRLEREAGMALLDHRGKAEERVEDAATIMRELRWNDAGAAHTLATIALTHAVLALVDAVQAATTTPSEED
jgi:hypothetical protein